MPADKEAGAALRRSAKQNNFPILSAKKQIPYTNVPIQNDRPSNKRQPNKLGLFLHSTQVPESNYIPV